MDDEMLIECVRLHAELYDVSDKKYINWTHKQRVWKEIAKYLGHSAITCKTRWNNIRDNYRKSLMKRVTKSGLTGQPRKTRYKYENQLTFLLPFIRERDPNQAGSIREGDEMPTVDKSDETPAMKRDDNRDLQTKPATSSEVTEDKTSKSNGEELKNEQKESGLIIPELTSSCSARSNDRKLRIVSSHSVDTFLASLAPTLKSLSPYYLNVTKTKIFSIVQKVEMIQILKGQKQQQARKRRATSTPNQSDTSSLSIPSMSPLSSDFCPPSPLLAQRINETN